MHRLCGISSKPWCAHQFCSVKIHLNYSSTTLDSWTDLQIRLMKVGGNALAASKLGSRSGGGDHTRLDLTRKYRTQEATDYKSFLKETAMADLSE